MKQFIYTLLVTGLFLTAPVFRSQAQITEIITQIIVAADVAVQKVQNATINLQNIQKELENELSQLKLGEIGDWEQKIKDLYSDYYQELWQVKTAISYFKGITGIVAQQGQLVTEYKQAYALIQQDPHFTPTELSYIYKVYTGIISESVKSLDEIVTLLTSFSLQMSDAARLRIINQASTDIQRETSDLRNFNNQAIQISLQRSQSQTELTNVMNLYGLPSK